MCACVRECCGASLQARLNNSQVRQEQQRFTAEEYAAFKEEHARADAANIAAAEKEYQRLTAQVSASLPKPYRAPPKGLSQDESLLDAGFLAEAAVAPPPSPRAPKPIQPDWSGFALALAFLLASAASCTMRFFGV